MIARHDPRIKQSVITSGAQVLRLTLGRPADIVVIVIGSEVQGPEGEGIGQEDGVEGHDSCRKKYCQLDSIAGSS